MQVRAGTNGGSGTLVAVNSKGVGVIVTAAHVIETHRTATAEFQSGYKASGAVLAVDPQNDVAAFMIAAPSGSRPIPVAKVNPIVGSPLEYIGRGYQSWTATASGYHRYGQSDFSLAGVPSQSQSGDSGGSVLCAGKLVGVITGWIGETHRREHDTGSSLRPIRALLGKCAPWSLHRPPRRPRQPLQPANPPIAATPETPPGDDLATLRREVAELRRTIESLEAATGPQGPRGPKGDRGPVGVVGPPGEKVDIAALAAMIINRIEARPAAEKPKARQAIGRYRIRGTVVEPTK